MAESEGLMGGTLGPGQDPAPLSVAERLVQLPGVWKLGWWMLMRPVSLHHRRRRLGIEPNAPGWRFLWRGDTVARAYAARMALLLLVGAPALAIPTALAFAAVGARSY